MAESNLLTTEEEVDLDDERPATATQESEATPTISKIDVQNDPLRDKAKVCLKKGNIEYRKGQTNEAMNSYTEGLQVNCKDTRLNAKLYSNRAAAHFHLGNYEECLSDATVSVQLEPNSMKAIKKGANACVKLCLYKEARSWLYKGLAIDENNKPLLNLLDKTNTELKARKRISYIYLGCAYSEQFRTEIEYHQHDLEIAKKVGDKAREGRRCASLGGAYLHLGQFKTAIKYIQRNLQIAKEVGDKAEEGRSYCNLGYVYRSLGEFKTAIGYFQRYLEIAKEVGDKAGEGVSYCNLGSVYHALRQFKTAIGYFQRHLEIAKEVGDKAGEGTGYCNLGGAYNSLGQFKNAIGYHQRRLEIAKEVGDKAGEGTSYATLGCAYFRLGQFKTAINCHQRHLEIAKEAGNKAEERIGYCNLGSAYGRLGLFKTAIEYQQRQLKIAKEVEDKAGEGSSYSNLGSCYGSLGKLQIAIEYYQRHLEIAKEVGDKTIEGTIYGNLGCAYNKLKLFETAMRYHQRHLEIAKEVGDKAGEGASYRNLGCSYAGLRQLKTAIEYLQRDLEITKEVGNKAEEASSLGLLGKCLEWEGNLKGALDVYDLSVEIHDDIMDRLHFNDIWKISYRNQHKDAYTGLWFIKLSLGEVVQALFAAEKGRAQALRDLLSSKYQFGDSSKYSSPCVSLSCVPSSTVFIAISGPYVYFWVVLGNGNVHLRKGNRLSQLPGAKKEVEMIGRIFNISPLIREMASKYEVLKRLSSVALVHIASHGKMETGEILLAPNTTRENTQPQEMDYLMTMKDVLQAGLRAQLVVLSCCHTARGEVMAEGVVGIARAFLGAGARSVVVTLWAIEDEATLEFMSFFYDALTKGKRASEALNEAMKCLRESGNFKDVKQWAPFVLIGDDVQLDFKDM
ncbi:Tetratricopeptide repeat protein 28 [Stylophora pistillata]|uniref:Tetratricopeptide repeat protein 28 n=1 Tax=Stylophora pistillata TaxID=50429 RepID=A0A2B4SMV1_STYPI|nr:Tetratricopeptide repeat protein 28 [Stylophora pistillata]